MSENMSIPTYSGLEPLRIFSSSSSLAGFPLQSLTRVLLLLSVCFAGCDPAAEPEANTEEPQVEVAGESVETVDREHQDDAPIDILSLKKEPWLETTSGVMGNVERSAFCGIDTTGFVGFYFLIDKENKYERIGKLTVQHPGDPSTWVYDNVDERFVSIELNSPRIEVWNTVAVGDSSSNLDAFVQGRFHYKKGTWVVTTIGPYQGEFQILNDRIATIKVRKTCPQQKPIEREERTSEQ